MDELTLVDYGMGNLLSVQRAFEFSFGRVVVTDSPKRIEEASKLILPGVGAFKDGMAELEKRGLVEPIRRYCKENRPFLGICLGMQMMLDMSHEFGLTSGLGVIPGTVLPLPDRSPEGVPNKIPHIGWSEVQKRAGGDSWSGTILESIPADSSFYFVHSFHAVPEDTSHILSECDYNGSRFAAVIRSGNLYGCQFHPEKSGPDGLTLLKNFMALSH